MSVSGSVQTVEREDIVYATETLYPDSCYFSPQVLWKQVMKLAKRALSRSGDIDIIALTSTSQRQGIVLIDQNGDSFSGCRTLIIAAVSGRRVYPIRKRYTAAQAASRLLFFLHSSFMV